MSTSAAATFLCTAHSAENLRELSSESSPCVSMFVRRVHQGSSHDGITVVTKIVAPSLHDWGYAATRLLSELPAQRS